MTTKFDFPPPNDDANDESYDCWLNVVCNAKKQLITFYYKPQGLPQYNDDGSIIPQEKPKPIYSPAWDGVVFTFICREDKELIGILESLQQSNWGFLYRSKLKARLLWLFNNVYFKHVMDKEIQQARELLTETPGYKGIVLPRYTGNARELLSSEGQELYTVKIQDYFGAEYTQAKICFDRNIQYVAEWAMYNFSYHRSEWGWVQQFEKIDIDGVVLPTLTEPEATESKVVKVRKTKKELEHERVMKMTPEERKNYLITKKLKATVTAMRRQGKLDEDVQDLLDNG